MLCPTERFGNDKATRMRSCMLAVTAKQDREDHQFDLPLGNGTTDLVFSATGPGRF
jgi:hypothetical protein